MNALFAHLCQYDSAAWRSAVELLAPGIHEIDRDATRIWFAFYPLDLFVALEAAAPEEQLPRKLGLMGNWRLSEQIDSSHRFLYSHRYWPQVKSAISSMDAAPSGGLPALMTA